MVRPSTFRIVGLCTCLAGAGCSGEGPLERTIRLMISTDLTVPSQLDGLTITALRGGDVRFSERYPSSAVEALPDSFLLHNGQRLDDRGHEITTPVELVVEGTLAEEVVVTRSAELTFLNDEPVVLYLPLCSSCANHPPCDDGQTCKLGSCQDDYVDVETLPADDGTQPPENDECPSSG